jgi:hypothetical protein
MPIGSDPNAEFTLLTPDSLQRPLWRRIVLGLRDKFAPETLPPLVLTSRRIDVGMLLGDRVSLPWYRTIFTNIGDALSPESLPPLELESRPVDVGELISDQMSHMWWSSLLRTLADTLVPERLPILDLTSKPITDPGFSEGSMLLPRWSEVIDGPKIFHPDRPQEVYAVPIARPAAPSKPDPAELEFVQVLKSEVAELKSDIRNSQLRGRLWVSLAMIEVAVLLFSLFRK